VAKINLKTEEEQSPFTKKIVLEKGEGNRYIVLSPPLVEVFFF